MYQDDLQGIWGPLTIAVAVFFVILGVIDVIFLDFRGLLINLIFMVPIMTFLIYKLIRSAPPGKQ